MVLFYEGSGLPLEPFVLPEDMTAAQRELDELGPVEKPFTQDADRWGVAVLHDERPGCFRVVRYADYDHASAHAAASDPVKVAWRHSGRQGAGYVTPLVASGLTAGRWSKWIFVATGWTVPL